MTVITENWLTTLVDEVRPHLAGGAVSTYLPELGRASADDLAVAVDLGDDRILTAGNINAQFTIQSVVKIFTLLLALHHRGEDHVFARVGRDQGIGSYNSLETFIRGSGVPVNPFVNAGALVVVDMLPGERPAERVAVVVDFIRALTGNPTIAVDDSTARSELALSDRNRALGYFLRSHRLVSTDVEELLWAYCQMCAIEVDVVDLARAGRVLADGVDVHLGGRMLQAWHVRLVRRLMLFSGMYEASGRYACEVGIPAKCGVSGAMIGVVPRRAGVGIYGPALDDSANSIGGLRLMRLLAQVLEIE
ncbi:glutaminase A [[Mycobacterium] burgundiense]|uniref:Glutaminase n=1 Tax=[Mycobacterium] burgundiense TaxID=3064286 RepID=A0ABM9M320_9MYCO|nr:glutaminase A [Mycolicibacterium sp. MU0053]CAJ1509335.1 glutaminase A [Mycolicibacterium sp. MU0053]